MIQRHVKENQLLQGADEELAYSLTTTPWGSSPGTVSFVVKDMTAGGTDVTATVAPGTASVSGDIITLPKIKALTAGKLYRVEVKFTCSGNIFEAFFEIVAET